MKKTPVRKLNICLVYPGYPPEENLGGGISTFLVDFSNILRSMGHHVTIISKSEKSKTIKKENINHLCIYRLPGPIRKNLSPNHKSKLNELNYRKRLFSLVKQIEKKRKFDIIEAGDWGGEGYELIKEASTRYRTVIRCHTPGFISESFNPSNKPYLDASVKEIEKYTIKNAINVTAYSKELMNLVKMACEKKIKYSFQPLFIKSEKIQKKIFYKKKFNEQNRMKILTVGRVEERKGIDILIKVLCSISQKKIPVQLDIIGSTTPLINGGNSIAEYKKHLSYEENKYIKFRGFLNHDKIINEYKGYDLFVIASRFESWGLAALEAIASGLPAVMSTGCTLSKYLKNNYDCYIFKNSRVKDLEEKIKKIFYNYSEAIKTAKRGKKTIKIKFNPVKETQKIVEYYKKIIKQHEVTKT